MSDWDELVHKSKKLEDAASKLQTMDTSANEIPKSSHLSTEEIDQLTNDYHSWYGDCLALLPDDLKDKFCLEYEGDGYSITKCIKKFLDAPLKYKRFNRRAGYRGMRVYDTERLYPYDAFFRNPLRAQRQILVEASKRKPKPQAEHEVYRHVKEKVVSTIKVLFLAANPSKTGKLMLDDELRSITEKVYASEFRDYLEIESCWAVRPDDLLQSFNRYKPHIVHFSGHGSQVGELILVDSNNAPKPVDVQALKALFTVLKDNIQVVILNACYSRVQAEAITEVINCAVGMNESIGDQAAITFAASFYRALGFGRSIQEAFDQGKVALQLEEIPEENTPVLLVKEGCDPAQIVLVNPTNLPTAPTPIPAGLSSKEMKRERLFNAYKIILNAAEEYQSVLHQFQYVVEGETKESRDKRLNTTLQKALVGVNDAMMTLTLEDVGADVKTIFSELRRAFHSYAMSLDTNAQYPNSFSYDDLEKDKQIVVDKVQELTRAMQVHLKALET